MLLSFVLSVLAFRKNNVIIITRDGCGWSAKMRTLCKLKGLNCLDLNVDTLQADVRAITEFPQHTFPSVFINGKHIGGYQMTEQYLASLPPKREDTDEFTRLYV